jgi:hypothetical protein
MLAYIGSPAEGVISYIASFAKCILAYIYGSPAEGVMA